MSRLKILGVYIVTGLIWASVARADVVVDASVSGTTGAYTYAYEIHDLTPVGLLAFSLTVTGDVGSIQSPTGWDVSAIPILGETLVQWASSDVPFDVPPFGTLSGFLIASDSGPGNVPFSTLDDNFSQFDGHTTGPVASPVPEPGTVALLASGLGVISSRRQKKVRFISRGGHC